jgi:hypothetical protein
MPRMKLHTTQEDHERDEAMRFEHLHLPPHGTTIDVALWHYASFLVSDPRFEVKLARYGKSRKRCLLLVQK